MNYSKLISTLVLLGVHTTFVAQVKKGNESFEHHHYEEAIEYYDKAIRKDLDNDEAITKMAICFWKTNQLPEAEYWFTRAALMNDDPEVKLQFSQVLIANEKFELAEKWLGKYMDAVTNEAKLHHAHQLREWARALNNGAFQTQDCKVQPTSINSEDLDFAPYLIGDELYFVTNRKEVTRRAGEYDPWTNGRFTDVFVAKRTGANTFDDPTPAMDIPLTSFHEGPICLSPDGKEMYMTTSDFDDNKRRFDEENNTRVKVVRMVKVGDTWQKGDPLSFYSREYNTAHAAISPDGKHLVFASDMEGGRGKMDLFICDRQGSLWGAPRTLGDHINTRGNEVFPYFDHEGNLYFASNWHAGFGGMDIFKCEKAPEGWGLPQNMGLPINSARDDFGICFDKDGKSGFLSSNRGSRGKDEILFFKYIYGIRIEGVVMDCDLLEPIPNAKLELLGRNYYRDFAFTNGEGRFSFVVQEQGKYDVVASHERFTTDEGCTGKISCNTFGLSEGQRVDVDIALSPLPAAKIDQAYLCGNIIHGNYGNPLSDCDVHLVAPGNEVISLRTGGLGSFYVPADEGKEYELVINRPAFLEFRQPIVIEAARDQCHAVEVGLEPDMNQIPPPLSLDVQVEKGMVLELYHIYFDRDDASIRADAAEDLETFYDLLVQYPSIQGEIMAHTDSRASARYNLDLSQRRAEAVMNELVARGINANRLTAKGYGETKLVNHCADGVECTETQHQRNRRVEFKVNQFNDEIQVKSKAVQRFNTETLSDQD